MKARLKCSVAIVAVLSSLGQSLDAQRPDLYEENTVRTLKITIADPNWFNILVGNKSSEKNIAVTLKVNGKTYKNVGLRTRGITSYSWGRSNGKLPLRITMDAFTPGQNLYGYKTLVLNNGYADPSFCREIISYKAMASRVPSSRANYVKVVINGANYGIYVNVQAPNKDLMAEHFRESDGNRYQGYRSFTSTNYSFSQLPTYLPLKSNPTPTAYHDIFAMMQILHGNVTNREAKLPDSLDVDLCLRQIAVDTVIGNHDGLYVHNYYVYFDPYHKRFVTLPWDLNQTYRMSSAVPNRFSYAAKLVEPKDWLRRYYTHVRYLTQEWCDWKVVGAHVARLQALIDAEVKIDTRGYGYAAFKANVTTTQSSIPGLKPLVDTLRANLLRHAQIPSVPPVLSGSARAPQTPRDRDTVWVSVKVSGTPTKVRVYHRVKGRFLRTAMFDDGKHQDGAANDGRYGASLPVQLAGVPVEYWFSAENANAEGLLPREGAHRAFAYRVQPKANSVVLNEILPRNVNGIMDNKGEREDWIELYNGTQSTVVVGGMYLTDDFSNPTQWQLPANLTLVPGQSVIIWADAEPGEGPFHASFKLSGSGEEVFLYDKDGKTLLDFVTLREQDADISTGRLEDGKSTWVTFGTPSPLQSNGLSMLGSRTWSALDRIWHPLRVSMSGAPRFGTTPSLKFEGATAQTHYLVLLSTQPTNFQLPGFGLSVLVGSPLVAQFLLPGNATGIVTVPVPVPNDPNLQGFKLSLQALSTSGSLLVGSNGLEMYFGK